MSSRWKKAVGIILGIVLGLPLVLSIAYLLTPGYGTERPWSEDASDVAGTARVENAEWPIAGESNEPVRIESVYTVGGPGISEGGEFRVSLGWLLPTTQRFYVPFSLTVSSAFFFDIVFLKDATVEASRDGVELAVEEPSPGGHFAKILRYIRYKRGSGAESRDNLMRQIETEFAVRIKVEKGTLQEGDEVRLVLGATEGLAPPTREAQWQVVWAVDGDGNGTFGLPDEAPWFTARAWTTDNVRILAPTTARVGEVTHATVRVEDDYFLPNLTRVKSAELALKLEGPTEKDLPTVKLPSKSTRPSSDPLSVWEQSVADVEFVVDAPGVYTIALQGTVDGQSFERESNPIIVYPAPAPAKPPAGARPVDAEPEPAAETADGESMKEETEPGEPEAPEDVEPTAVAPEWMVGLGDQQVYFGDLHLHSILSYDADRPPDYVYWRQRYQERHDFAVLTDHDMIGNPGFIDITGLEGRTPDEWEYVVELAERWYEEGEFVTLRAHEWTSYYYGHRNIFYAPTEKNDGFIHHNRRSEREPFDSRTPDELRDDVADRDVIVIPHSSAWPTAGVTFEFGDPDTFDKQRLLELYSTHGTSEYFDNEYAVDDGRPEAPTDSKLVKKLMQYDIQQAPPNSGNFAQDALAAGWRFGFLGSSDMHFLSHIDQAYQTGWAGVWADGLDRDSIWEALQARRTYATTGVRIFVRFDANGEPMGSEIASGGEVSFRADVEGTGPLDRVQIVKYDGSSYSTLVDEEIGDASGYHGTASDPEAGPGMFYYLKVRQDDGHFAWSSPIWIDQ